MGLSPLYGRISLLRETDLPELRCALTGDGYVARTEGFCAVGATYEPGEAPDVAVQEAHEDLEVEKSADGVGNQTFLIQEAN